MDENPIERRITLRLVAYWERLRNGKTMPSENDIDPDDIGDLWDNCFMVQVRDLAKTDYNYTYLGRAIIDAYCAGLSPGDPEEFVSLSARDLASSYTKVIETRKPVVEEGEFRNLHNDVVRFRQCLLPLGYNGMDVDAIFGGMRFKIFPSNGG